MRDAKTWLTAQPTPGRNAARGNPVPEPDFTKAECVVGLECRIRRSNGVIVKVHQTDTGLQLYRFRSTSLYVLVTRDEIKRIPNKENHK